MIRIKKYICQPKPLANKIEHINIKIIKKNKYPELIILLMNTVRKYLCDYF
jgi:hypothetical protein